MGEDGALFDPPDLRGATWQDMRLQIEAWQAQGRAVGPIVRRALLDQSIALDLAKAARRATQISGASRVLLELLQGFHLTDDAPPAPDDPFLRLVEQIRGDALTPPVESLPLFAGPETPTDPR